MKAIHAAALAAVVSASLLAGPAQAQAVRNEVAKPLAAGGDLLRAGKAREALGKVREAEAVGGKNPAEQLLIDKMKGAAAQRAGDNGTAIAAFESAYGSGRLSGGEQARMAEQLAFAYYANKNNGKALEWASRAKQAGGGSPQLTQLVAYLQQGSGDYGQTLRESSAQVNAAEKAGQRPGEDDLLRMADAARRTNSTAAYSSALEKLVLYYGKKDYWSAHLASIQRKPGFSPHLGLDVWRLKLANGLVTTADEYMELAQLALQAGLPAEAKTIMDKGYAANLLGVGEQAARHGRLRDLVAKTLTESNGRLAQNATEAAAEKDGNGLVKVGTVYTSLGQADKAIEAIEKGIAKGQLKRPDDAKLRLALAMLESPKTKAKGLQQLRGIGGTDGTADIGRLYAAVAR
jgi:tetratricopeptide (TPR) repeat protein